MDWNHHGIPHLDTGRPQYCTYERIVSVLDTPENLNKVAEAMRTERFDRIMQDGLLQHVPLDMAHVFRLFKRDFWRELILSSSFGFP